MSYRPVLTLGELQKYLAGATVVAFDFETSPVNPYRKDEGASFDPHKSHIVGMSFSITEGDAIYVPLAHLYAENAADQDAIWAWLADNFFTSPAIVKVAHNLAFEASFLYALGIVVQEPCYDTIAASQLLYKNETDFRTLADSGLKKLAAEFFDAPLPSFADTVGNRHFDELAPTAEDTVRYACADSDYTLRLYHKINGWFDRFMPKHRFVVERIESPTAVYVGLMSYNGIPVDVDLMERKDVEADRRIEEIKEDIAYIIGDVNIGKNAGTAAFKRYLFDTLGLPKVKMTETDKESLDDEALILLKEHCEKSRPELVRLFDLVEELRSLVKVKSTYIEGYMSYISNATGRIHPDMLPLATETGRFASKNPNCQNMPRAGSDDIGVRNFITAPEGKLLLSLDFSQIELRVGAFYCKDQKMIETYQSGGDIHAQTTAVIYRIPIEEAADKNNSKYKERRTIAKNCNFGVFFGLYPNGLQKTLKFKAGLSVSIEECETIIRNIKTGYPALTRWQEETKKRAAFRKYTQTWLGRRRTLKGISSPNWSIKSYAERCAMNTPIQGTAADILKLALGRILKGLPERPWLRPLLQIHDELVFELPENKVKEAAIFIKYCMEEKPFDEFSVPIVAEPASGKRFGELKEFDL